LCSIQLGPERHRAPELLFNPELVGLEDAGVHQVVVDSINRADLDLRKSLFGNVVLSGGGTLVKGTLSCSTLELNQFCTDRGCDECCRLWRSITSRGQETGVERNEDSNQCTSGTKVLDLDRWKYLGWFEHVQEDVGLSRGVSRR